MRSVFRKTLPLLTVLVALAFWVGCHKRADLPANGVLRPFVGSWSFVKRKLGNFAEALGENRRLRKENQELLEKVWKIQAESEKTIRLVQENKDLRKALALPKRPGWKAVIAEVSLRDPANWNREFRINHGEHSGVRPGSVVLVGEYVIGRVLSSGPSSAVVRTIASRDCRFGVTFANQDVPGILQGTGLQSWREKPECKILYLPKDIDVPPGILVLTSGLGGPVPAGLAVGMVMGQTDKDSPPAKEIHEGAYASLRVSPLAKFSHFRFVTVICQEEAETEAAGEAE